jgi:hypothetical protein
VDSAVNDEPLHGFAGDFAADGVEAGQNDGIGGIIDQDRDAGGSFEGADIASFSSDDAAFDVISLKDDCGGGIFEGVITGVALEGGAEDSACFGLGPGASIFEDVAAEVGGVAEGGFFDFLEELGAGFGGAEVGDTFELLAAAIGQGFEIGVALVERSAALFEFLFLVQEALLSLAQAFELGVDEFFAFGQLSFEAADLVLAGVEGGLGLAADFEGFLVGGEAGFAQEGFAVPDAGLAPGLVGGFSGLA